MKSEIVKLLSGPGHNYNQQCERLKSLGWSIEELSEEIHSHGTSQMDFQHVYQKTLLVTKE